MLRHLIFGILTAIPVFPLGAQFQQSSEDPVIELPTLSIEGTRVANVTPAGSTAMPVTLLRYEPRVDIQTRGIAETQADVTIRGGIFDNTGFKIGAATVFDPQTGHYFAELPIHPTMLSAPGVATGADNAQVGFNSLVGTLEYAWTHVREGVDVSATVGAPDLNAQDIRLGWLPDSVKLGAGKAAFELAFSRSEGEGSLDGFDTDHQLYRYAGRAQIVFPSAQTDLYVSYQAKEFSWPGMYTANTDWAETENLQTTLVLLNHRMHYGEEGFLEVTGYYRKNRDHYSLDGGTFLFNAFHETQVWAGAIEGFHETGQTGLGIHYHAQWSADDLDSTTLTNPNLGYTTREYFKASVAPEYRWDLDGGDLIAKAGVAFDDTDRDRSEWSPFASLAYVQKGDRSEVRYYAEVSETSSVPNYTPLASQPTSGLFRGDASLGREESRTIEAGIDFSTERLGGHVALFYREDDDLVDFTFDSSVNASRFANPVDLEVRGFEAELFVDLPDQNAEVIAGYTYLDKTETYGNPNVDASFYGLNFARHRATLSTVWRPIPTVTIRTDVEARENEPNTLRTSSDQGFMAAASVAWSPQRVDGLTLTAIADNITESNFEDNPGTPAEDRQVALRVDYRF